MNDYHFNKLINLAIRQANKVDISFKKSNRARLGAVIWRKKYILNTGFNKFTKTHPKSKSLRKDHLGFSHSICAELDAIVGCDDMNGSSILVVRLNMNNELKLARPCQSCWHLIKEANLRHVFWSNNEGHIDKHSFW